MIQQDLLDRLEKKRVATRIIMAIDQLDYLVFFDPCTTS